MGKVSTFANRLKTLLAERSITQAELARRTGISKSSITRYVKGDWEGKQDAVYAISAATDVNEAWLMGYDVPMDRSSANPTICCEDCGMNYNSSSRDEILTHDARGDHLRKIFYQLNEEGQTKLLSYALDLKSIPIYRLAEPSDSAGVSNRRPGEVI